MRLGKHALDLIERQRPTQLDGERLAVAAHGTHAHAHAVDRDLCTIAAEDLVRLDLRLPFLAALAIPKVLVDPGQQARRERVAELRLRQRGRAQRVGHRTVDVEHGARRVLEQRLRATSSRMLAAPAPEAAW